MQKSRVFCLTLCREGKFAYAALQLITSTHFRTAASQSTDPERKGRLHSVRKSVKYPLARRGRFQAAPNNNSNDDNGTSNVILHSCTCLRTGREARQHEGKDGKAGRTKELELFRQR
jgi:hypothetical protein